MLGTKLVYRTANSQQLQHARVLYALLAGRCFSSAGVGLVVAVGTSGALIATLGGAGISLAIGGN